MKETPQQITYTVDAFPYGFQRGYIIVFPNQVEKRIIDVQRHKNKTVTITAMHKSTWLQRLKIRLTNRLKSIF